MLDSLITLQGALRYLNISRVTLIKLINRKAFPATKVGKQWRFKKEDIEDWLKLQEPNKSRI